MVQRNLLGKEINAKDDHKRIEQKSFFLGASLFFNRDFVASSFIEYLNEDDVMNMSVVSKEFDQENSPYWKVKNNRIQSLFRLIAIPTEENIKEAKRMVERNYRLLLIKMPTTVACYGQELKGSFSALQRIACNGDFFLAENLLTCLPEAANSIAAAQLKKVVNSNGDFLAPYQNLINAYKEFSAQHDALFDRNNLTRSKELLTELWLNLIGSRQRLLPEFALQQFCFSTSSIGPGFYTGLHSNKLITFDTAPERRSCQLYDKIIEQTPKFIKLNRNSLGVDFALYRGNEYYGARRIAEGAGAGGAACCYWLDMKALCRLCEVIKLKFGIIIKRLDPTFELEAKETSSCLIL